MRQLESTILKVTWVLAASSLVACGQTIDVVSQETEAVEIPAAGAGGEPTASQGNTTADALTFFQGSVASVIEAKCATCHADSSPVDYTKFLPGEVADYHARLTADGNMVTSPVESSYLIVFGGADVSSQVHVGTQFSAAEEEAVKHWLALETGEDPTATPSPVTEPTPEPEPTPVTNPDPGDPVSNPVDPDADPLQLFTDSVQPALRSMCAGCHEGLAPIGPVLMGDTPPDDDYIAVTSDSRLVGGFNSNTALLLLKGPHSGSLWWDGNQHAAIVAWLNAEFEDRNGGEAPEPSTAPIGDQMEAFVGCMNLSDWNEPLLIGDDEYTMGMWGTRDAEGNYDCASCHSDGEFFFAVNADNEKMFNQQRTSFFARSFFTLDVDPVSGRPTVAVARDKIMDKCQGNDLHPECRGNNLNYLAVVEQFRELTLARQEVGDCGPAAYIDDANVFEAQDLELGDNYIVDQNNGDGEYVRLIDNGDQQLTGTVTGTFNAPSGQYSCYVVLVTENDGQPTGSLTIGDQVVFDGTYPLGPANFQLYDTARVVVELTQGAPITWNGTRDQQAYARWDEFRCTQL